MMMKEILTCLAPLVAAFLISLFVWLILASKENNTVLSLQNKIAGGIGVIGTTINLWAVMPLFYRPINGGHIGPLCVFFMCVGFFTATVGLPFLIENRPKSQRTNRSIAPWLMVLSPYPLAMLLLQLAACLRGLHFD